MLRIDDLQSLPFPPDERCSHQDDVSKGRDVLRRTSPLELFILQAQRLLEPGAEFLPAKRGQVEEVKVFHQAVVGVKAIASERSKVVRRQRGCG